MKANNTLSFVTRQFFFSLVCFRGHVSWVLLESLHSKLVVPFNKLLLDHNFRSIKYSWRCELDFHRELVMAIIMRQESIVIILACML